ncbi:hypothetical protein Tco_0583473 [Tanacetum coccineum]
MHNNIMAAGLKDVLQLLGNRKDIHNGDHEFTSRDGESMECITYGFTKLMNELQGYNLQLHNLQVNFNFFKTTSNQKWSRFVTIVKHQKDRHRLTITEYLDFLKQFQLDVNDIVLRENISQKQRRSPNQVTPQYESVSGRQCDPEQARRDKDMKKNLALLAKYFKKLYKPTNNNLRTSSNSRKRWSTTPRKPKRVKDYAYHKEKMMMCKQAEQGVPLQAEQADWLEDTDEEIDEQELEAHYSYMAKIQEVSPEESSSTGQPLEQDDSNVTSDSSNICTNDNQADQNVVECVNERDALANLIANLTLDTEENKTIFLSSKKSERISDSRIRKDAKLNLDETNSAL